MNQRNSLLADICFAILLMLLFICFVFIVNVPIDESQNLIILAVIFTMMIITYFTNITFSLVLNFVIIFGYTTFIAYRSLNRGIEIQSYNYFWMVMCPLLCICVSLVTRYTLKLQKDVEDLESNLDELTVFDEDYTIKNLKAFNYDAKIYSHIASRYNSEVVLLVFEPRYKSDIERLMGKSNMHERIMRMVKTINDIMRNEDEVYILDKENFLFGILLLTQFEAKEIIIKRVKKSIANQDNLMAALEDSDFSLDIRVGVAKMDHDVVSPLQLLDKAKSEIQYDVL